MKRIQISNVRRFGYRFPHQLNKTIGYRGGVRF